MTLCTANNQEFEFDVHDRLANAPEALVADGTLVLLVREDMADA